MAREFSCFGVLLWQKVLSADVRKLEEKKSTNKLSTNQLERPGHCCEAVTGPANRKHQDHNFIASVSLKHQWSPHMAIRFYVRPELVWFHAVYSYFWLWNVTCAYFPWSAMKQFFLLFFCTSKFLFYSTCFSFLPSVLLWPWDSDEADFQEWAAMVALAGVNSVPWVWVGRGSGWLQMRPKQKQCRWVYQRSEAELSLVRLCPVPMEAPAYLQFLI